MFDRLVLGASRGGYPAPEGRDIAQVCGNTLGGGGSEAGNEAFLGVGAVDVGLDAAHGPEGLVPLACFDKLDSGQLGGLGWVLGTIPGECHSVVSVTGPASRGASEAGRLFLATFYSSDSDPVS